MRLQIASYSGQLKTVLHWDLKNNSYLTEGSKSALNTAKLRKSVLTK